MDKCRSALAKEILIKTNYIHKKPDSISIARYYGFQVCRTDFLNPKNNKVYKLLKRNQNIENYFLRGFIISDGKIYSDKNFIFIQDSQSLEYERFTNMYLLSKFLLDQPNEEYIEHAIDNLFDLDALELCREILIPNELYKKETKYIANNIENLSKKYNVPDFIAAQKILKYGGKK